MKVLRGLLLAVTACVFVTASQARQEELNGPVASVETRVETKVIPFEVKYEVSRTVGRGRITRAEDGSNGFIRRTWQVTIRGGKVVSRKLVSEERKEPVHTKYLIGSAGFATSRGSFSRGRVLTMEATAYTPDAGRGSNATFRTKTGRRAEFGVVAVDPRVIPLNTMVYVEGYGLALACDIGGAIKGNRIDLCMEDKAQALQFGRRQVRVHILKTR